MNPGDLVLDYAAQATTLQWRTKEMVDIGVKAVVRYLCPSTTAKRVTKQEVEAYHAAGIGVLLVWEHRATDALLEDGSRFGLQAAMQAHDLGYPVDTPIIIAVDTDITAKTLTRAVDYVHKFVQASGWKSHLVYGDTDIIDASVKWGLASGGWKANARAWSPRLSDNVLVEQFWAGHHPFSDHRFDGLVDYNRVLKPLRAWGEVLPKPQAGAAMSSQAAFPNALATPEGKLPYYVLTSDGAHVQAWNGAKLDTTTNSLWGIPFFTLPSYPARHPAGLIATNGRIDVAYDDGFTLKVASQ